MAKLVRLSEERVKIDARARVRLNVVENVLILGPTSVNEVDGLPVRYSSEARRGAAHLYEGMRVNVDHPTDDEGNVIPDAPRSYRDRFARLRNVRAEADGLRGDLHVNPKHDLAEQFLWDAEHAPDSVGLSHNAQGRGGERDGVFLVESIVQVRAVDVVADPATTNGLFEHRSGTMLRRGKKGAKSATTKNRAEGKGSTATVSRADEMKAAIAEAQKSVAAAEKLADEDAREEAMVKAQAVLRSRLGEDAPADEPESDADEPEDAPADDDVPTDAPESRRRTTRTGGKREDRIETRMQKLERENDELRVKNAVRERRERVESLIDESDLPDEAVTDLFVETCVRAKDDKAVKALIEDRRTLALDEKPRSGGTGGRTSGASAVPDDADKAVAWLKDQSQ